MFLPDIINRPQAEWEEYIPNGR